MPASTKTRCAIVRRARPLTSARAAAARPSRSSTQDRPPRSHRFSRPPRYNRLLPRRPARRILPRQTLPPRASAQRSASTPTSIHGGMLRDPRPALAIRDGRRSNANDLELVPSAWMTIAAARPPRSASTRPSGAAGVLTDSRTLDVPSATARCRTTPVAWNHLGTTSPSVAPALHSLNPASSRSKDDAPE